MVNNSTNINKTNNHLSLQLIENKKQDQDKWHWKSGSGLGHAQTCGRVYPVNGSQPSRLDMHPLLDIKKLRNNSWKPYCVLSLNMGWRILVFKCSEVNDLDKSFIRSRVVFTKYQSTHFLITVCMVPSSFLTYHGVCNKSNTMGATCGAGTAYSSWTPEFTFFFWPLCCLSLINY